MKESIKVRVMRRVLAVYYLRKVLNRFVLKTGILLLSTVAFGSLVHVAKVFENMPQLSDVTGMVSFGLQAFINTDLLVQSVLVLLGAVTLWLMRDIVKLFVPMKRLQLV